MQCLLIYIKSMVVKGKVYVSICLSICLSILSRAILPWPFGWASGIRVGWVIETKSRLGPNRPPTSAGQPSRGGSCFSDPYACLV